MGWRFNGLAPPKGGANLRLGPQPDLNVNARSVETVGHFAPPLRLLPAGADWMEVGWSSLN